ncbi:hypothetical protein WJX79_008006 [Trebouxia sp. C0005]
MSKQLQQQVDRLQHEHPIVRRYAVANIFQLLAQHNTYNSKAGQDALQECFKQSSKEVVEETAQQLHAFVPKSGLSLQDAVDIMLAAVAVPGATAVVPSLVDGLFALLQTLVHGAGASGIMAGSSIDQGTAGTAPQSTQPAAGFVMLHPDAQGKHMALKTGLHAQLTRAVCTLPLLQPYLTEHLVSYLAAYSWADPLESAWLSGVIPDVVDAAQSVEGTRGDRVAEQLAAVLVQLVFEAQGSGLSLQPFLAGLRRLASEWPSLLTPYIPLLGACITAAGNSEAASLMQLMAQAAQASPDDYSRSPVYGMLSLPLMSTLTLHPSQPLKAWAGPQTQHGDMPQEQQAEHARVQLALMRAIPCMAMHQTALPFVQRALMPFSRKGTPELSHALALKMHTQIPMLRTVRAACVRDVCDHDSTRGLELVRAIQECVEDQCESVAALGLQAIALLCEDDVLEFYAAWRVVHKALPKIPQQGLVAAEWVNLLRHGVLDADVYADKATVIIDMLWSAAGHASSKVRAAAYAALAAYPMDLLETLEALRPLQQCVQLLVRESDAAARVEAEVLVGKALAHEHLRRRRYIGSTAQAPAPKQGTPNADPQSVEFQLTQALPKQLLQQSAQHARRASQGVTLLLWGPPPPPSQGLANPRKADSAEAAQQAEAAYHQTFQELVEMPSALGSSQHALLLHSWGRFLARWLSAGKAAIGAARGRHKGGLSGVHESSYAVWRAVASSLDGTSPIAAENAAAAAAALCAVLPAGSHGLVTEVVQKLRRGTESQSSSLSTACALALGSATAYLHPTDTQTLQHVLDLLLHFLINHPRSSFTSACAESLGLLAASSSSSAKPTSADSAPAVQGLQSANGNDDGACETLSGVMSGLANAAPALAASGEASLPGAFLHMLQRIISDLLDKAATLDSGFTALVTKLPSAALGKQGVALGLVALLGGQIVGGHAVHGALLDRPDWSNEAKYALQVVIQLALDEADPRVATIACWGLAAACHAQRHKKSNASSVGGINAQAQMRALTGLPQDGAMRALAQLVMTGAEDDMLQAPPPIMAGVLRCLADAPRLPTLDWGTPAAEPSHQIGHQEGEREGPEEGALLQRTWGAACACLQMIPQEKIMEMLSLDRKEARGGSSVAAFATAVMVQMGKLPLEALQPVRQLVVSQRMDGQAAVMSAVAAAVHHGPAQHTILLETLDAVQAGDIPEQALQVQTV